MGWLKPSAAVLAITLVGAFASSAWSVLPQGSVAPRAAAARDCASLFVHPEPNGSFGAGASRPIAIALSCARARAVMEAWFAAGHAPTGWREVLAANTPADYDPVFVLARAKRFILVPACGGGGCPGRPIPTQPRCDRQVSTGQSSQEFTYGLSCAAGRNVLAHLTGQSTIPGWNGGSIVGSDSFNCYYARGTELILLSAYR